MNKVRKIEIKFGALSVLVFALCLCMFILYAKIDILQNEMGANEVKIQELEKELLLLKQSEIKNEKKVQEYKTKSIVEVATPKIEQDLTEEEINLVCHVVNAEAGDYGYDAQKNIAVAIFNRMNDGRFPDNITDVLYQHDNGVWQFSTIQNNSAFEKTPTEETRKAVYDAYEQLEDYQKVIFFESKDSSVHEQYAELCFSDNAHKFYRKEE